MTVPVGKTGGFLVKDFRIAFLDETAVNVL